MRIQILELFLIPLIACAGLCAPLPLAAAQTPTTTPATGANLEAQTETIRLKNGKTVVGVVVNEEKKSLVVFNGAGNLTLKRAEVLWRRPGGTLEASGGTPAGLVQRVTPQTAPTPVRLHGPRETQPAAGGTLPVPGTASLAEILQTPEAHLDSLAEQVRLAGPGPVLIEIEALYRVRPVNKAEAYAQLRALEKKADALLQPIARMTDAEIKAELTKSPFSNEETFGSGKYNRLSGPDTRRLLALRRLVHAFNKETYFTYAVNASFTDLLDPRRPMGDCNSSCALIYHLAWHAGYGVGIGLYLDLAQKHAVLVATCDNDSRPYFAETTGGFLSDNRTYAAQLNDPKRNPAEDRMTVVACLMNEGFPSGLSALQNLRLATILRLTSADPWSAANFRHYFVTYLNNRLDADDQAAVALWSKVYDQVEGAGAFERLPRKLQPRQ